MKAAELKDLSTKDLREKLQEEKSVLTKLKLGHTVSPIENPMKIKSYRKAIAKLQTEIRKREIAEQKK